MKKKLLLLNSLFFSPLAFVPACLCATTMTSCHLYWTINCDQIELKASTKGDEIHEKLATTIWQTVFNDEKGQIFGEEGTVQYFTIDKECKFSKIKTQNSDSEITISEGQTVDYSERSNPKESISILANISGDLKTGKSYWQKLKISVHGHKKGTDQELEYHYALKLSFKVVE